MNPGTSLSNLPMNLALDAPTAESAPVASLGARLRGLRQEMLDAAQAMLPRLEPLAAKRRESARNLLHYLALRRADRRELQEHLAALGLSSLGRSEGCVLGTLTAVQRALDALGGRPSAPELQAPFEPRDAQERIEEQARALFGEARDGRAVRILVTLPGEAAQPGPLVRQLLEAGMDAARINCAHDDVATWTSLVDKVRLAERETGRTCRVLVDLAGPKLRTGPVAPGPAVRRIHPRRDALGHVVTRGVARLVPSDAAAVIEEHDILPVGRSWLRRLRVGDALRLTDARGRRRVLRVTAATPEAATAETARTCYVVPGSPLRAKRGRDAARTTRVGSFAPTPGAIHLHVGDTLVLTRRLSPGRGARVDARGRVRSPARIGCTLPEAFSATRPGHAVWFDDGKIGGVIRRASAERLHVEITRAQEGGSRLVGDKGINLPDTDLPVEGLTAKDEADLAWAARRADAVSLSFVCDPNHVVALRQRLQALGGAHVGIVLKIETRRGFERLPELLLAALAAPVAGVMIARGDLAVECGFERLAEVQEEMLWLCEAAHTPVVWATQVLEGLAKSGQPSRAEVTDAAMGERAECVMLNKGPHILKTVRTLGDILQRMGAHQHKKRSLFRPLKVAMNSLGSAVSAPPKD